jgi:hypothetical protein
VSFGELAPAPRSENLCGGHNHALAQDDDEVVTVEPERQPLSVQAMLRDDSHAESWRRVLEHLKTSTATYWLATGRGSRHASCQTCPRGVGGGRTVLCADERTRKARNLGVRPTPEREARSRRKDAPSGLNGD